MSPSPTEGVSPGVGQVYGPLTATGPCSGISPPTQLVGKEFSKFLALWLETEKYNKITVHSHDVLGCLLLPLVWRAQKTMTQRTGFVVVWVSRAISVRISSVQSLSRIQLFVTPWTEACQASLSVTNSQSLLKLMYCKLVMPSNHLILCCPLLLLHSLFSSIRVFSNESVLHIMWPKYWRFSFSISSSNDCSFSRNCISNFLFFSFSCAGDAGMTLSRCWAAATTCPQPGGSNRHT